MTSFPTGRAAFLVLVVVVLLGAVGYRSLTSSSSAADSRPVGDGRLPDETSVYDDTHAGVTELDPDLLRALRSEDPEARAQARHALYGNVFHQCTRYQARYRALPFLYELVSDPATLTPSESAASGFCPTERTLRPQVVLLSTHQAMGTRANAP